MNEATLKRLIIEVEKESLSRGSALIYNIKGISMLPCLVPRDKVRIMHCQCENLRSGDIIVLYSDSLIAHRFIRRTARHGQKLIVTKGDTQWHADLPSAERCVVGKVISIQKGKRQLRLDGTAGRALNLCLLAMSVSGMLPGIFNLLFAVRKLALTSIDKLIKKY